MICEFPKNSPYRISSLEFSQFSHRREAPWSAADLCLIHSEYYSDVCIWKWGVAQAKCVALWRQGRIRSLRLISKYVAKRVALRELVSNSLPMARTAVQNKMQSTTISSRTTKNKKLKTTDQHERRRDVIQPQQWRMRWTGWLRTQWRVYGKKILKRLWWWLRKTSFLDPEDRATTLESRFSLTILTIQYNQQEKRKKNKIHSIKVLIILVALVTD